MSVENMSRIVQMYGTKADIEDGVASLEEAVMAFVTGTNEVGIYTHDEWAYVGGTSTGTSLDYPEQVIIPAWFPAASSGNTTLGYDNTIMLAGKIYTANTQNSYMEYPIVLAAGTWRLDVITDNSVDRGIHTVSIDGSNVGTYDCYAGSQAKNQIKSITGISIVTGGKHTLRFTTATKHASSTGYVLLLYYAVLTRTGV